MSKKMNPGKVVSYLIALFLFGVIAAGSLVISAVFIVAGGAFLAAVLSGSAVVLFAMKAFGLVPNDHPVLHIKRAFHYAIEIPARITMWTVRGMLRVPVLSSVMREMYDELSDDKIIGRFDAHFRTPEFEHDPYLHGDLARVANVEYPQRSHRELWTDVPHHLRVSFFRNSRLPNGKSVSEAFAPNVIDSTLVAQAMRRAALVGLLWFAISFVVYHPTLTMSAGVKGTPVAAATELTQDFWSAKDRTDAAESQTSLFKRVETLREFESKVVFAAFALPLDATCSLLFALFVAIGAFRGLVRLSVNSRIQPFAQMTPDSIAIYNNTRAVRDRVEAQDALVAQIEKLKYDTTPVVQVGTATGRLEALGVYNAPREGMPVSLSFEDFMNGIAVMGGIGSGKSRTILSKLIRGLLAIRATNKSLVSIYSTDDKGVLWRDFKAIAEEMGQGGDVVVVGCKPDQVAIDPFAGAEPSLITDALIAALMQRNGGKADFFSDASALHINPVLTLLRAYMHTPDAKWWVNKFGSLPYSLDGLERIATEVEPFALTTRVVESILTAIETGNHPKSFAQYVNRELHDHIRKVRVKWRSPGGEKVRDSIIRTIETIVSGFASSPKLRAAFGTGLNRNVTTIDKVWGKNGDTKIFLVDLSSSEYGSAGNLVNQLLKIRLYNEAAQRQVRGETEDGGWLFKVFDEFQSICSASGSKSTYDDGTWPGQCRSAKSAFIVASQQINSIRQVLGTESTAALLNNLRSRFVLPVECTETIKTLVGDLAGTVQRVKIADENMYESYHAMRLQTGFDVFRMVADKPRLVEIPTDIVRSCWAAIEFAKEAVLPTNFVQDKPLFAVDMRFICGPSAGLAGAVASGSGNDRNTPTFESYMSSLGAAHHRSEDLKRELLKGTFEEDAIKVGEMTNLVANNRCLAFVQNANGRRVDFIEIG